MIPWFRPFGRARQTASDGINPQFAHGSSPQYMPGQEPAGSARQDGFKAPYAKAAGTPSEGNPIYVPSNHPAVVTDGFDDCGCAPSAQINYGYRTQPDVGGALNYAYENYELPLVQPGGAFMVAKTPFRPLGAAPLQVWPVSVPTGIGLIPGQVISQPLLNPQGPDTGYDIYN
jgi:hypothetical protein